MDVETRRMLPVADVAFLDGAPGPTATAALTVRD